MQSMPKTLFACTLLCVTARPTCLACHACLLAAVSVTVQGWPTGNWTAAVTSTSIIVTYTASDRASNRANTTRTLSVYDPCTAANAAERTCLNTGKCSVNGNCNAAAAQLSSLFATTSTSSSGGGSSGGGGGSEARVPSPPPPASAAAQQALAALTVPDTTPPTIQVRHCQLCIPCPASCCTCGPVLIM
jgi:hypothetical protein